jgi:hypothetical protein
MKGDFTMEPVWESDLKQLTADTKALENGLEILEQDHANWNRDRERKDLNKLLEGARGLESDVSTLMSDCFRLDQLSSKNGIKNDLKNAFKGLDILFEDLKTLRAELDQTYLTSDELTQLEIDWGRFAKSIKQIKKDLVHEKYNP